MIPTYLFIDPNFWLFSAMYVVSIVVTVGIILAILQRVLPRPHPIARSLPLFAPYSPWSSSPTSSFTRLNPWPPCTSSPHSA